MYRELISPLFVSLDNPEVKELACYDNIVFISQLFLEVRYFITGVSCDDTVYQCACELICRIDPVGEIIAKIPLGRVLEYDSL